MLHSRIAGSPHFSLGLFPAVLLALATLAAAQETVIHSFPSHPGDGLQLVEVGEGNWANQDHFCHR